LILFGKINPTNFKKAVLSNSRADGGLEVLNFIDTVNTFKVNWLKRCLANPNSLWFFIPNHIFDKIGGLSFVLICNYAPNRLPVALSKFHQQSLLAWKLCYTHNFSPHRTFLWNNNNITIKNTSLFYPKWFERNIVNILSLFDEHGSIMSYENFITKHSFPIPFKELNAVTKAIPSGLSHLIKSHVCFHEVHTSYDIPTLSLNGMELKDKCNNRLIRQILQSKNKIIPRGKFYWNSHLENINWKNTWLLPHKFGISNKVKEINLKILHKIYPVNSIISKYMDVDSSCFFCGLSDETFAHLFF
jgi:hypothetical protein